VKTIKLGNYELSRIGLGTNRISDTSEARDILRYAISRGVNLIDTAHVYTGGTSERVIGETLSPFGPNLAVATKGGMGSGGRYDGSNATLAAELGQSLASLRTSAISLYQLHRVDPAVGITQIMRTLKHFLEEGKVEHIGLSEVSVEQIKQAQSVAPISSVQNHYNVEQRSGDDVVDYCEQQGIIFMPFFPLGGRSTDITHKLKLLADKYSVTPQQIALAWLLMRSPVILPIPGTLSTKHLDENLGALDLSLSAADYSSI
jgi:pyridoxine 4-dehydrogenase